MSGTPTKPPVAPPAAGPAADPGLPLCKDTSPLDQAAVAKVAGELGCEPAAIWAVCQVESSGSGFLPDGRMKILFEAEIFSHLTNHVYDKSHPFISSATWNPALYGATGPNQYVRLGNALPLNRQAALEATSWGAFQIMGFNYTMCGFASVAELLEQAAMSAAVELEVFAQFVRKRGLDRYLASKDWTRFALGYNGSAMKANHYDTRLAIAYAQHSGQR